MARPLAAGRRRGRRCRLAQLARAMPAACRAAGSTADAAPARPAAAVLSAFVDQVVDVLVHPPALARPPRWPGPAGVPNEPQSNLTARTTSGSMHWCRRRTGWRGRPPSWGSWRARCAPGSGRSPSPPRRPFASASGSRSRPRKKRRKVPSPSRAAPGRSATCSRPRTTPACSSPAADAWEPRQRGPRLFRRRGFRPREYLLSALGQAAGLCPPIEASLKTAAPAGFAADAGGAHEFLTETAWLLEQAGFGVLLPAWWTRKGTKHRLSVRADVKTPPMTRAAAGCRSTRSSSSTGRSPWATSADASASWRHWPGSRRRWCECAASGSSSTPRRSRPPSTSGRRRAGEADASARWCRWPWARRRPRPGCPFEGVEATGWLADLLAQLEGHGGSTELAAARGLPGHPPALPGARLLLAGVPAPLGAGRLPGRRHGPGQDDPDPRPAASTSARPARPAGRRC